MLVLPWLKGEVVMPSPPPQTLSCGWLWHNRDSDLQYPNDRLSFSVAPLRWPRNIIIPTFANLIVFISFETLLRFLFSFSTSKLSLMFKRSAPFLELFRNLQMWSITQCLSSFLFFFPVLPQPKEDFYLEHSNWKCRTCCLIVSDQTKPCLFLSLSITLSLSCATYLKLNVSVTQPIFSVALQSPWVADGKEPKRYIQCQLVSLLHIRSTEQDKISMVSHGLWKPPKCYRGNIGMSLDPLEGGHDLWNL